jgi:hypothetical protein
VLAANPETVALVPAMLDTCVQELPPVKRYCNRYEATAPPVDGAVQDIGTEPLPGAPAVRPLGVPGADTDPEAVVAVVVAVNTLAPPAFNAATWKSYPDEGDRPDIVRLVPVTPVICVHELLPVRRYCSV